MFLSCCAFSRRSRIKNWDRKQTSMTVFCVHIELPLVVFRSSYYMCSILFETHVLAWLVLIIQPIFVCVCVCVYIYLFGCILTSMYVSSSCQRATLWCLMCLILFSSSGSSDWIGRCSCDHSTRRNACDDYCYCCSFLSCFLAMKTNNKIEYQPIGNI